MEELHPQEEPRSPPSTPTGTPTLPSPTSTPTDTPTLTSPASSPTSNPTSSPTLSSTQTPGITPSTILSVPPSLSSPSGPCCSSRTTKGTFQPTIYVPVFLSSVLYPTHLHHESELAYLADLSTNFDTRELHCYDDPRAYAAKHKVDDPDMPLYMDALSSPHSEDYMAAMKKEAKQLIKQKTWTAIHHRDIPKTKKGEVRPILKGTWAFKLKCLPDGSPSKFKARYCVRGDLQQEDMDYFETYTPVIQWSTVRRLLTLILSNDWTTKIVDYTNVFVQATLNEEVHIELPRGFFRGDGKEVLKLNNNLYGLKAYLQNGWWVTV